MAGSPVLPEPEVTEVVEEPLFSYLDIILLVALAVAGLWWLFKRNKKEEFTADAKSYTIT